MSELRLLKSYNFVDKDPVIDKMRGPVKQSEMTYAEISDKSGVSASTIYNWFEGKTKRPQYATVVAVMRVLGYKEFFVKKGVRVETRAAAARQNLKDLVRRA
jgi:transcriptional regulator with XRE-family HTH domain